MTKVSFQVNASVMSEMNFDLGGSRRKGAKLCNQGLHSSSLMIAMVCLSLVFGLCVGVIHLYYECMSFSTEKQLVQSKTVHVCDVIRCLFICHSGGGISSYAGQPGAAERSLEVCLDQAVKDIPKERHQLTPVYLGATAGMRLLQ